MFSLEPFIKCQDCIGALKHTDFDPCSRKALILMKNRPDAIIGLCFPSGSVQKLAFFAEKLFRKNSSIIHDVNAVDRLIYFTLDEGSEILKTLFPLLQNLKHYISTTTTFGPDDHVFLIIRMFLKKFFSLRIKKVLKDMKFLKSQDGNSIHRLRIFKNL